MNTSRLSTLLAEGIFLWAMVQDAIPNTESHIDSLDSWGAWVSIYPDLEATVKAEQNRLFDIANNLRYGRAA